MHGEALRVEAGERVDDVRAEPRVQMLGYEFALALAINRP